MVKGGELLLDESEDSTASLHIMHQKERAGKKKILHKLVSFTGRIRRLC